MSSSYGGYYEVSSDMLSALTDEQGEGFNVTFTEVCREARRNEGDMMAAWYDREGDVKDGLL